MFARNRDLKADMTAVRSTLAEQSQSTQTSQQALASAQQRISELEDCERQLKPWKERESKIMYYLGVFKEVMQENEELRQQLRSSGHPLPQRKYPFELGANGRVPDPQAVDDNSHADYQQSQQPIRGDRRYEADNHTEGAGIRLPRDQQNTSSSRTLSGPNPTRESSSYDKDMGRSERPIQQSTKRQHEDDSIEEDEGRRIMPPPPLPRRLQHNVASTVINHTGAQQAARIAGGASLLDEGIVLLDDGTWRRESPTKQRELHRPSVIEASRRPFNRESSPPPHFVDTSHVHTVDISTEGDCPDSQYFTDEAPRRLRPRPFGLSDTSDRLADARPIYQSMRQPPDQVNSQQLLNPVAFGKSSAQLTRPPTFQAQKYTSDIYTHQSRDPRHPLGQIDDYAMNRQDFSTRNERAGPGVGRFNQYAHREPERAYQPVKSFIEPRTPSPKKRLAVPESVSSPFFGGPRTASQHTGRITLPHRTGSAFSSTPLHAAQPSFTSQRPNFFAEHMPPAPTPSPAQTNMQWAQRSGPSRLATEARRGRHEMLPTSGSYSRIAARR